MQLPREAHNAPLHFFSASPEMVGFASATYHRRSEDTSKLLKQLFVRLQREGLTMSYTMADFRRDYVKEYFPRLTPEEQSDVLQSLSAEKLLAVLTAEQIRELQNRLTAGQSAAPRKPRRKK